MHQKNTSRRRSWAMLAMVAFVPLGLAATAHAQAQDTQEVEEIVVTGTYIKGTPEDAPLPVTTLQRDDLALEGTPTTIDLIKSLSFSQGADGETDQFQAGAGADRGTINIRGLGPSRSLVLLNGRRTTWSPHAIGAQAQLLVDVNMLPSIALQRIEVLRDGAAATYGSDAIAGVMNFITRGDFEGFEVMANHKIIADSDGDTEFGAIWGGTLLNGRLQLMTSASYIERSQRTEHRRSRLVVARLCRQPGRRLVFGGATVGIRTAGSLVCIAHRRRLRRVAGHRHRGPEL